MHPSWPLCVQLWLRTIEMFSSPISLDDNTREMVYIYASFMHQDACVYVKVSNFCREKAEPVCGV